MICTGKSFLGRLGTRPGISGTAKSTVKVLGQENSQYTHGAPYTYPPGIELMAGDLFSFDSRILTIGCLESPFPISNFEES